MTYSSSCRHSIPSGKTQDTELNLCITVKVGVPSWTYASSSGTQNAQQIQLVEIAQLTNYYACLVLCGDRENKINVKKRKT